MKMQGLVVAWLLLVSSLAAQTAPPAMMVKRGDTSVPLGLSKLETEVRIFGSVAETTTTMTFVNRTGRTLQGDLYFPLPEGATISGYALDINGTMVDGVAVEKHKARRVFEEIARQRIDPGLVEWTKGNNFHTRVFPIPADGSRTVRVQYVSELIGGEESPAYHLPLKFKDKVPEFSLRVEVVKPASAPKVAEGGLANFAFEKWQESYVAKTQLRDWKPTEDLVIALPRTDGPQVLVEKADDGQVYFAIRDYPTPPTGGKALPSAGPTPGLVVVLWDASGSRAGDHTREISLLRDYLKRWVRPDGKRGRAAGPAVDVDLVLLRNVASKPKRFELDKKGLRSLIKELENVQYDGGTQLGAIEPVAPVGERPNHYLLFTDGISNFGQEEPGKLDGPLDVFCDATAANHPFLRRLAIANGGRYFNLARWKDADILAQAGRPTWSFLSASIDGGEADSLYPQLPQPIAGQFTLVGKLAGPSATVRARYGYGIADKRPAEKTFTVSSDDAPEGSLLRRLWAEKKLAELMVYEQRNEKEIAALGKQFGLVTPYTSLLVLESLDQYVEHEVTPPESLGDMRQEYLRRIDTLEHQEAKKKADKLKQVVEMWDKRVKWYDAQFKYPKNFKYGETTLEEGENEEGRSTGRRRGGMAGGMGMGGGMMGGPAGPASPAAPALQASAFRAPMVFPEGKSFDGRQQPGIAIAPWNPKTPYLKRLQVARNERARRRAYMTSRAKFGNSPAFFLDCAEFFRTVGNTEMALQVLSNIAELELENPTLLRVLGHRLAQIGRLDLAVQTFETVLDLRPEEPQSYRDLALVLARRAEEAADGDARGSETIRQDYARAIDLLNQIVVGDWDDRFPEIEVITLEEVNRIIPRAEAAGVKKIPVDRRLVKPLTFDVRVVMTWQADETDIDLWVTEPSGEKADYSHNRTTIGGLVSSDFTGGYGPEEYLVRKAATGSYQIDANYYGSRSTRLLGPVTVQVDVFTNYGREKERRVSLTFRLKDAKETVRIGQIEF